MLPAADGDDANSAKTIVFSWLFWPWAGEQSWLQKKWRITWQPTQTLRIYLSTTVSPSHLYLHIYSSSCGYLRTEVTNKEVCVQAAGANKQKAEGDVTSAAVGGHIMCHWTMLEPCSCVLSHTAACWPLPAGDTVMMQSCVVVCSLWTLIWWLVTQLCLVTLVHCFPLSIWYKIQIFSSSSLCCITQKTSLPYFGVKLSCVCLMFADRKK